MIRINKDILSITGGIICQQMNGMGIAGAGLALQTRQKYPRAINEFIAKNPGFGECMLYMIPEYDDLFMAFLVGQMGYGRVDKQTNYGALSDALHELRRLIAFNSYQYFPVYFPYGMGAGLGGGDWEVVQEMLEYYFPNGYICKFP